MKKLLANYAITLSDYLSKIASQLDNRFRYFHINLPPKSNKFVANFDNKETLDVIKSFNSNGGFDKLLDSLGANNIIDEDEPEEEVGEVSKNGISIMWEHYRTNYVDSLKSENLNSFPVFANNPRDDDDDDDDGNGGVDIEDIFPQGLHFGKQKRMHFTPWGKFEEDDPFSPVNLYDLQVIHFKGFTTKSIPNFGELMSSIEGISAWGQIDPYCIVLAPAKSYKVFEVKNNTEKAIYSALGVVVANQSFEIEDSIISAGEDSLNLFEEGIENFVVVFPEPNFSIETFESPDEDKIKEIDNLISMVKDLIVIKNGDFYNV